MIRIMVLLKLSVFVKLRLGMFWKEKRPKAKASKEIIPVKIFLQEM